MTSRAAFSALQARRIAVLRYGRELADERAACSAHRHDVEMCRRLREIIEELAVLDSELRRIDAALAQQEVANVPG
jgi:hypothetical protein